MKLLPEIEVFGQVFQNFSFLRVPPCRHYSHNGASEDTFRLKVTLEVIAVADGNGTTWIILDSETN